MTIPSTDLRSPRTPGTPPRPDGANSAAGQADARLVWDTWRRILSDDALAALATQAAPIDAGAAARAGLDDAELAVLAEYAATPQATRTNLGMFRRSLERIARVALGRVPLSAHLLYMSGLDVDAVVAGFTRANRFADDGPHFWRLAGAFVAYLATRPELAAPAHQDLFALDQALVALARRLGQAPPACWPNAAAAAGPLQPHAHQRFEASRAALVAASRHDLTDWIENPWGFDPAQALAVSARYWLVYFPDADSAPAYAELTERSARLFALLATPRSAADLAPLLDLSEAAVLRVIAQLAELGVAGSADFCGPGAMAPQASEERGLRDERGLSDDAFVLLDPAVELLDVAQGEYRFLSHADADVGMAVPPGEGLTDFVMGLAGQPVQVGALRCGFDDRELVDTMLAALQRHGLLHVCTRAAPTPDRLAQLRGEAARRRAAQLRKRLVVRLDGASAEAILARVEAEASASLSAPLLQLECERLAEHGAILDALARLRQAGRLRLHHSVVLVADPACDAGVALALRRLGAAVVIDALPWPAPPQPIAGIGLLARSGVALHARFAPGRAFFDAAARAAALAWAAAADVCGLSLVLDADSLWPPRRRADERADERDDGDGDGDGRYRAVFDTVHAMGEAFGDVRIDNLPADDVLVGNAVPDARAQESAGARAFRLAYLRWRLPLLHAFEGDNLFSQTPASEEKLVRLAEDLLPNHPALLAVPVDGIVVDVCGGNGRVARRLAPLLGADGLVVSVEMLHCVSERARRFACELGVTNVQFRTGLAQRIPFPDGAADAAVNEWTGAIWELGLGAAMVGEMARVVRPGGRVIVTHRLARLALHRLGEPWVQFEDIYALMHAAFAHPCLVLVGEKIWGQTVSSLAGERASAWRKHYLPRVVNPFDVTYTEDKAPGPHADVCLTMIAERI